MNKQDFIRILRQNLSGMTDYEYVNDTVSYYENYIESEIRKGKSEDEVLAMLGDPRLIAKSVKASRGASASDNVDNTTTETLERTTDVKTSLIEKFFNLPMWAKKAIVFTGGAVAIVGVGLLISWMFPVIVIGIIAYFFYKFVRDNFLN